MSYNVNGLTIKFDSFGSAAFEFNRPTETARILRDLAKRIQRNGVLRVDGMLLKDINGNSVGSVSVAYDAPGYDGELAGEAFEISGTYSDGKPATIFVFDCWYAVKGRQNVNCLYITHSDLLVDGVDVETLPAMETFTTDMPVEDLGTFEQLVWENES